MEQLKSALAEYISTLETSAEKTNRAEDRTIYQKHLAAAALMYVTLEKNRSLEKLKELVATERHSYGWGYLDGSEGDIAETAFDAFAKLVEAAT